MNLVMETVVTEKPDETMISGMLRNAGAEAVKILLEFMYHRAFAVLKDDKGRELKWDRHEGAKRGFRPMSSPPKVRVLQSGEAEEVAYFTLSRDSRRAARSGDLSWSLTRLESKTLTVELVYEVEKDAAMLAKRNNVPGIPFGRWTSRPVTLPLQK